MFLRQLHLCADEFPVYCLAVAGCVFSALLVDLKEVPSVPRIPGMPTVSWPYHIQNLKAVSDLHTGILTSCLERGGVSQQCAYCARCQASNPAGKTRHSSLSKLKVRPYKAALLSSSFARACASAFPLCFYQVFENICLGDDLITSSSHGSWTLSAESVSP